MPNRSSSRSTRGTPTREPYPPWASLPGWVRPSRSGSVSWSESNDSATAAAWPEPDRMVLEFFQSTYEGAADLARRDCAALL